MTAPRPTPQQAIEDRWIPSACDMCYNACTIQVHRVNGVVVKIEGIPEAPPNYGKICAKGNAALMNLYSPHRIRKPLRRTNPEKGIGVDPQWQEISWEEALDVIVARLKEARQKDPRSLILATFDRHSFLPLWAWLSAYGSPNFTTVSAGFFCGNGVHPVAYTFSGANDVHPDLSKCNYLIQFGTYYGFVAQTNAMGLARELSHAKLRGMKMTVIDPMLSYPASQADEWVPIRPGTDAALALSMMHVLINELDLYDRVYLQHYTNGPYLVGANGRYLREEKTGKPLVWDAAAGKARPYDAVEPQDAALEGEYRLGTATAKTAFQVFREHLCSYPPEATAPITTVPPETTRRIAREFGEAARIGSTVVLDGREIPLRPAAATWYRGISAHKHAMHNGLAVALLNLVVGAIDVPGGILNGNAAGPYWFPQEGPDGLLQATNPFTRHHLKPIPPRPVRPPETLELIELFPLTIYSRAMLWLGVLYPEQFGLPYRAEVLIQCRSNLMATTGDPQIMAEALKRIPFIVSFADHHNETSEFADILLPDTHALERLVPFVFNSYLQYTHAPLPGEDWSFNFQQPVIEPQGEARYWVAILYEIAERLGIQGDVYTALNSLLRLEEPYRLDPAKTYPWEEICDVWAKAWCGEEHGLEYFKKHSYLRLSPRTVEQSYPRPFHRGRIPLYLEHFITAGEDVKRYTEEHHIPWDTSDYVPLVHWRPCPAYEPPAPEYDLFLVNHKVPFLTFSFTADNPWLMDLAKHNGKIFNMALNPQTARRKGLKEGDLVELTTPAGRSARATIRLTEGIHPEVAAVPSILGRWVTSNPQARQGVHFNSLIAYTFEQMDTVSAALDACVRVKVTKVP